MLETEIPLSALYFADMFAANFPNLVFRNIVQFFLNQRLADLTGFRTGIIDKILLKRHQRIWQTAVVNLQILA